MTSRGPLEPGLITRHKIQGLVDGLDYLHAQEPPIVHGDIHPVCEFQGFWEWAT